MGDEQRRMPPGSALTRRDVLRGALAGGAALGAGGLLAACGGGGNAGTASSMTPSTAKPRSGGKVSAGATGGGATDTIDAHNPVTDPDHMRVFQLYEPLVMRSPDFSRIDMLVAESLEPEKHRADVWTVRLRRGIEFHDGRPVTADDVIFSLKRILNPKKPGIGANLLADVDTARLRALDARTVRITLRRPNAAFPDNLGQYFNAIVPVGYDPAKPVGTGPFKYQSFTPGQQSVFTKFANYWETGKPYLDELQIIDFTDDTARVNALLGGQVQVIDNLPTGQIAQIQGNSSLRVLNSRTGSWQPFTMRVDQAPFSDARVRQAMRLVVNRPQMVEQVLSGQGRIANDLYAPYDPVYASQLPQRQQDVEQAKSLLAKAGRSGLSVELVTAPVFQGVVQAAQVFAQQASAAGVKVQLRKVDTGTFYGANYLKWPFSQDFWANYTYLSQVALGSLPSSPFNETHWQDPGYLRLIDQARGVLDETKRKEILQAAQKLEYDSGGYIIPYFSNLIDAYSAKLGGLVESKSFPLGNFGFRSVGFVA
jgi:peptide/nickel transport system substrate-binding protein